MSYRYSYAERLIRKIYRRFFPVPTSPWTSGNIEDICAVNLVPPADLTVFFKNAIQILQNIRGNDIGDYLEFGVFNGNSMACMHKARSEVGLQTMNLFGFDAFEGLPAAAEHEDDGVWKKGFYACSFEKMKDCLSRRNIDSNEITWVKGWYDQILKSQAAQNYGIREIGIVLIDCDTYSSSKTVLDYLAPQIKKPVIICLDDWKLNDLDIKGMGEYQSFNEFLESNPYLKAKSLRSYNRKSRTFLVSPA